MALPKAPRKPEKPYKPKLIFWDNKPSSTNAKIGFSIILGFIIGLFVALYWGISIGYVVAFFCSMAMVLCFSFVFGEPFNYLSKLEEYKADKARAEKMYADEMIEYNNVLVPNYPNKVREWNKKAAELRAKGYVESYRRQLIKDILKKNDIPRIHPKAQELKKGVTEDAVLTHLNRFFPGKVYINCTAADNEGQVKSRAPLPDFVIHDVSVGYNVVIEIDEPYDLEFGHPIHYIGRDTIRDEYFLQKNWPVLRFAEKQFFLHPDECCNHIALFINAVTFNLAGLPVNNSCQSVPPLECWSEDEAVALEIAGFRESYLPAEVLGNSLMGLIYKDSGYEIRKRRREQALIDEAEHERKRVERLMAEEEERRRYRYRTDRYLSDEENDLPF